MNATEEKASETEEAEFYALLFKEMDRQYAKYTSIPTIVIPDNPQTAEHNNPERD